MGVGNHLSVIIIGSGLAGLAAARILRETHQVTVYERGEPSTATGGQGIASFPNATKILRTIGFDAKRTGSVLISGFTTLDKGGKVVSQTTMPFQDKYGAPLFSHMRVDFRTELLRLATAPSKDLGIGGEPAKMVFNNGGKDIDPEAGLVTLDDGSQAQADVVIVADGIHSRLRPRIAGSDCPKPEKSGLTCCRVAVSADEARKVLGRLPNWWQEQRTGDRRIMIWEAGDGSDRLVVVYGLRHTNYMNLSCVFPTRRERESTTKSWFADGDRQEMLDIFRDFDLSLLALLGVATEVKLWELQDIEPLPTWTSGRTILIGDAAHAMTPLQGQGANMSIEDAEALRLLMEPGVRRGDVPDILKRIEHARKPRNVAVLRNTRKTSHGVKGNERYVVMDENCTYDGIYKALGE
ncbi:FAD binding domain protein [Xylariaceae sp. FL0662B]|nr:FAD binding domain protein [Xylariaceae sp. FL0662B]